jgi:hypothetical protein
MVKRIEKRCALCRPYRHYDKACTGPFCPALLRAQGITDPVLGRLTCEQGVEL